MFNSLGIDPLDLSNIQQNVVVANPNSLTVGVNNLTQATFDQTNGTIRIYKTDSTGAPVLYDVINFYELPAQLRMRLRFGTDLFVPTCENLTIESPAPLMGLDIRGRTANTLGCYTCVNNDVQDRLTDYNQGYIPNDGDLLNSRILKHEYLPQSAGTEDIFRMRSLIGGTTTRDWQVVPITKTTGRPSSYQCEAPLFRFIASNETLPYGGMTSTLRSYPFLFVNNSADTSLPSPASHALFINNNNTVNATMGFFLMTLESNTAQYGFVKQGNKLIFVEQLSGGSNYRHAFIMETSTPQTSATLRTMSAFQAHGNGANYTLRQAPDGYNFGLSVDDGQQYVLNSNTGTNSRIHLDSYSNSGTVSNKFAKSSSCIQNIPGVGLTLEVSTDQTANTATVINQQINLDGSIMFPNLGTDNTGLLNPVVYDGATGEIFEDTSTLRDKILIDSAGQALDDLIDEDGNFHVPPNTEDMTELIAPYVDEFINQPIRKYVQRKNPTGAPIYSFISEESNQYIRTKGWKIVSPTVQQITEQVNTGEVDEEGNPIFETVIVQPYQKEVIAETEFGGVSDRHMIALLKIEAKNNRAEIAKLKQENLNLQNQNAGLASEISDIKTFINMP
ncbi:MAG: hypothetical protein UR43_C0020G0005 [candidate division TM6 bacterium GW2011_GWF2_33_332]|nr:MAG: hypothetical protein UR43_C0020G0005 [candidate division TM6 bacterium GW2011_GWF2_33_332]